MVFAEDVPKSFIFFGSSKGLEGLDLCDEKAVNVACDIVYAVRCVATD